MIRRLILLVCLLLPAPLLAKPLPDPVALRGFTLGLTLEEFRRLPYPEADRLNASAVCTGDPLPPGKEAFFANLWPEGPLAGLGNTICRFYTPRQDARREYWDEAGLVLPGAGIYPTAFLFTPLSDNPATSQRLFRIVMRPPAAEFDKVQEALIAQYGPPSWTREEKVKNAMGAELDDPGMVWETDKSQMVLTKRVIRAELSRLSLSDRTLLHYMQQILQKHAQQ